MDQESQSQPKIARLVARSGLKGDRLAKACGWERRNGPQPYLEGRAVTLRIAQKFAQGLVGLGDPPITEEEVLATIDDPNELRLLPARPQNSTPPFNEDVMAQLLHALLPLVPPNDLTAQSAKALSGALLYGFERLEALSANEASGRSLALASHDAASRFLEALRQSRDDT